MNVEELREYCLSKKGTSESLPFDDTTLVFKVMGKMYALLSLSGNLSINLKCEPEQAVALREKFSFVLPGYHMNKKHWNTIRVDFTVSDLFLKEWIDHSYVLIVNSLTKKLQNELINL